MKATPEAAGQRPSGARIAAALGTAGVVAIALGGNLLGAGAQDAPPVPGEPVPSPPTQVAADDETAAAPPASGPAHTTAKPASATTQTARPTAGTDAATTPAPDTTRPPAATQTTTTPAPSATQTTTAPAPSATQTTTTPAPDATQTTTTPAPDATQTTTTPVPGATTTPPPAATPPPASAPAAPAPAAAPAAPAPPIPTPPARPLPLSGFAGPADEDPTPQNCPPSRAKRSTGPCATKQAPKRRRTVSPQRDRTPKVALRNAEGVPTTSNPTMSLALPGAVPVGVPNFFIEKFRIPPFLLPIYQAAGIQYGVRWEVLAAINEIETDYGRNLNVSSAGALGWMQFMPATWKQYGTDANRDGRKDPFNPVDAIFAAARYLRAAGADQDLRKAIFAYNHADWYVESVLMRARLIGGLPADLVGSLSGLTQGHFPVYAKARYADDLAERALAKRAGQGQNVANPIESDAARRGIDIFAKAGSPAIAVQDGTIVGMGTSARLGNYVRLRDVYGNTYTYAHLKTVARNVPVPKRKRQSRASIAKELRLPKRDPKPTRAASAATDTAKRAAPAAAPATPKRTVRRPGQPAAGAPATTTDGVGKERLFAHPARSNVREHGGARQILEAEERIGAAKSMKGYFAGAVALDPDEVVLKPLVAGRRVMAGTIIGRVGRTDKEISPRLHFEIRPAGRGAPRIDPKPILDGWKLLESTAIYRARNRNPLVGPSASRFSIGQILLMSKEALQRRVLANPRIEIYSCGRRDIEAGGVDRRVLATLEFLAASGLKPTVTSLHCGHGYYTSSGNVSAHSSGNAVDIAKINGIPILGHQGEGSITDIAIRRLLTLQGTVKPNQIISLMDYQGADNTMALGDHADHIHVGFRPQYTPGTPSSSRVEAVLKPSQWIKLIGRLGQIDNPKVSEKPSKYAIPVPVSRASSVHRGE